MKLTLLGHIMKQLRKFFTNNSARKLDNLKTVILKNKIKDHKEKSREKGRTDRSRWHHRNMARHYEILLKREQDDTKSNS